MAYTKTHQSSNLVRSDGSGVSDSGYNQAFAQVLEHWLPTRGWTVESEANNASSGVDNNWHLSKTIECVGGTQLSIAYGFRTHNDIGHVDWSWFNGLASFYATANDIRNASSPFSAENNVVLDGYFEMWSHDTDPDSFVLIVRGGSNFRLLGFWPPSGSIFRSDTNSNDATKPGTEHALTPLFMDRFGWDDGTVQATQFWVGDDNSGDRVIDSLPFVLHNYGAIGTINGTTQFALINDPDVSTLLAMDAPASTFQGRDGNVDSVQIGAKYYIALGQSNAKARLLLNTDTVNLED